MADRSRDEQREMLIVGDRAGALEPDEAADVPLLADLLADPSTWAEPRPGLEDVVVEAVSAADAIQPRGWRETASARGRGVSRVSGIVLAAAAAIAIVAIVSAIVVSRGDSSPEFTADLAATELIPGARATADITPNDGGFRIVLDASGLPSLAEGEFYQGWLKDAEGTLVPIGTFSSSDDQVTLWSGVSPADFPLMTVTIEKTDNDQTSSGRVVLAGPVEPTS